MTSRLRLPIFISIHLLASGAVAGVFAWRFGHEAPGVAAHVLLFAEWDFMLAGALIAMFSRRSRLAWAAFCVLLSAVVALQFCLYALDAVSNISWGRNLTAHLVTAFAPTIWSGQEPFPVGPRGIVAFGGGALVLASALVWLGSRASGNALAPWNGRLRVSISTAIVAAAALAGTLDGGVAARDNVYWKDELVASFLRPVGYAFEPTARRHAMAERDAILQASYPRQVKGARRTNVVLIIVDSLRADHMQVYGYGRPTTPFLSQLTASGRMKKVDMAFSTCSESFCGITSTLSGREFPDISARTFQLQDVLHDEGYQTWFLLSGNHTAWNGLTSFYHATDGTLFDGSRTERYTMDDDRLVLEGLARVPPAARDQPAFFYVHLMSTHYLGVEFPTSHVFTTPGDDITPGAEPYAIVDQLQKRDRYDDKVLQADSVIKELFIRLAAKHYLDDAIVVVTGDHGEGLGERHWAHGWHLYDEDIRIPMLLYDVSATKYPDLSFATQVDIAPTIIDRLGLPTPTSWEGRSLLEPVPRRFTFHQTYFLPNRFAVIYRNGRELYKLISTPDYGKEELYDLRHDTGEAVNLVDRERGIAALLRERLREYREE